MTLQGYHPSVSTCFGMDQLMNVYTPAADGSAYTVVLHAAVRCRAVHIELAPSQAGFDRNELAARRVLRWDPAYVLPSNEDVQVVVYEVDADGDAISPGIRYNLVAGTMMAMRGPGGVIVHRRADIIRAVDL